MANQVSTKSPVVDFIILPTVAGHEVWPRSKGYYANEHIGVYPTHEIAKAVGNAYINGFADGVWHGGGETVASTIQSNEIRKAVLP